MEPRARKRTPSATFWSVTKTGRHRQNDHVLGHHLHCSPLSIERPCLLIQGGHRGFLSPPPRLRIEAELIHLLVRRMTGSFSRASTDLCMVLRQLPTASRDLILCARVHRFLARRRTGLCSEHRRATLGGISEELDCIQVAEPADVVRSVPFLWTVIWIPTVRGYSTLIASSFARVV